MEAGKLVVKCAAAGCAVEVVNVAGESADDCYDRYKYHVLHNHSEVARRHGWFNFRWVQLDMFGGG